jgi:hypothetical protein
LVFLSGSFGLPERQKLITQQAAKLGYSAINLRYPNSWKVGGLCSQSKDRDCHGQIRKEILTGTDYSPLVDISQANSLENRLVKLLKYLDWQQYLNGNNVKWELILIAGHSQGGGEAFFIAKQYLVAKAIAFASPTDYYRRQKTSARWLLESGKTPVDRFYGFVHSQDRGLKKILQAWKSVKLDQFGSLVNIDEQPFPYKNSHQLVTSATPRVQGKYHGSVVVDKSTPLSSDAYPLFHKVWTYLLL